MDDEGAALAMSPDGKNLFVLGTTHSFSGFADAAPILRCKRDSDVWLMKYDLQIGLANPVWEKFYGKRLVDTAEDIALAPDGKSIYLLSSSHSDGTLGEMMWIIKIDLEGNVIWDRFDGIVDETWDLGHRLYVSDEEDIYAIGESMVPWADHGDDYSAMRLVKYDKNGQKQWEVREQLSHPVYHWQFGRRHTWSVALDADGQVVVHGTDDILVGGNRRSVTWLLKYDADGNKIWENKRTDRSALSTDVAVDGDTLYVLTNLWTPETQIDASLMKYSQPFVRGDANYDQNIDISDTLATLNYLFSNGECLLKDTMDVDDDGKVGINDPIYLLMYLFNNGPAPAAPFPSPGVDPTPDDL